MDALVLNVTTQPIGRTSWQRAIELVLGGKATIEESYEGRTVSSQYLDLPWPAVIQLTELAPVYWSCSMSRANVLARDNYTCQYCGTQPRRRDGSPRLNELTLDHVVPRAHEFNGKVELPWSRKVVRVTSWENCVAACYECNFTKRDRTPAQAAMRLLRRPRVPTAVDVLRMSLTKTRIPSEWKKHLPEGSEWSSYWDGELDPS